MIKLYFKKLLSMLLCIGLFFVIYYLGSGALMTLSNFFKNPIVRYSILFGIPVMIIIALIFKRRLENAQGKREYLKNRRERGEGLKNEWLYLLGLPDFRAEAAAFATALLPFLIAVGIGSDAPFWADLLAGAVLFCLLEGVLLALDFSLWLTVHIKWVKQN